MSTDAQMDTRAHMCMHPQIRAHMWAREHIMHTHAHTHTHTHTHSFSCLQTFARPAFSSENASFPTPGLQEAEPPGGCSRSFGACITVTCAPPLHISPLRPSGCTWSFSPVHPFGLSSCPESLLGQLPESMQSRPHQGPQLVCRDLCQTPCAPCSPAHRPAG